MIAAIVNACKRKRLPRNIRRPKRVITLLMLAGLSGCSFVKHHGICMVAGCIDTHFEPEPNVVLPATHFYPDPEHFGSLDRVPWPYQKVGVITVTNFQSDKNSPEGHCQAGIDQAYAMARTIGGDGLVFDDSVACFIYFHATLIRKVPLSQTPDLDHPADR